MYDNWAEVRRQLDQELASERQQRRARRRQQSHFGQSLWHAPWHLPWRSFWLALRAACFPYFVRPLDKVELTQTCDGFTQPE